jgi:hypothetical protein
MHWDWASFGIGIVAGFLLAVVAWFVVFFVLMSKGDQA